MRLPYSNTLGVDTSKAKIVSMGTKLQERAKAIEAQKEGKYNGTTTRIDKLEDEELHNVLTSLGLQQGDGGSRKEIRGKDGPILDSLGLQQTYEALANSPSVKAAAANLRRLGEHVYSKQHLSGTGVTMA